MSDNETLAENKVLILYILNKINKPLTNSALYELVLETQDINYFYFQQFLLDLHETKYINNYMLENENVYEISGIGKNALNLLEDLIPGIIKLKMENSLKKHFSDIEEKNSISAEYIPISETEFSIKCKIIEKSRTIFEISTIAGSRKQAKEIVDKWNSNAEKIYPELLKILT